MHSACFKLIVRACMNVQALTVGAGTFKELFARKQSNYEKSL